jgi:hypothetical protein
MEPGMLGELTGALAVFFVGAIILVPVVALSVRFSLKPLIEARARLRHGDVTDVTQDRRLALLEAEMQNIQGTLQGLVEVDDFRRQLATPDIAPAPVVRPQM